MADQRRTDTRALKWFLGLTFGVNWLMALLFWISGAEWGGPAAFVFATAYMIVPLISAVVVQKIIRREPVLKPLRVSLRPNRWWLAAGGLLAVLVFGIIKHYTGRLQTRLNPGVRMEAGKAEHLIFSGNGVRLIQERNSASPQLLAEFGNFSCIEAVVVWVGVAVDEEVQFVIESL